jgi:hypothetical protein
MAEKKIVEIAVSLTSTGPEPPSVVLCDPKFGYTSLQKDTVERGYTSTGYHYTLLNLPKTKKGDEVLIRLTLAEDLLFATSPVQWVRLDIPNPKPLVPLPPPEAVLSVSRINGRTCEIDVRNPGEAGAYRFMLVLFWAGKVAISDPTLINPPPEHNEPPGKPPGPGPGRS